LFNRIAPGVLALCLAAALPPGAANGGHLARRPLVESPQVVATQSARPSAVKSVNAVLRIDVGSRIDLEKAVAAGVSVEVLELALTATSCAATSGAIDAPPTLTLIDYSRPSTEPRLWVFDLGTGKLLFKELVAHGRNTGDNFATKFSNEMDSRQTSLGLFVTDDPYVGSNGYSLRLDGLDVGFNDRARDRAIVMHGAPYVNEELAAAQGRIGRSWGCPALRTAIASKVIDRIRGGSVIFSYYPDQEWLQTSRFLQGCGVRPAA
jgi:L,D-transpeptidase catalytic domain